MTVQLSLYCPPMAIRRLGPGRKITDREPMKLTVKIGYEQVLVIDPVTIPQTHVYELAVWNPLRWQVDACTGIGVDKAGNSFVVDLPPQITELDFCAMGFVARSITAKCTLSLADGRYYVGEVVFPDSGVKVLSVPMVAEAVMAEGWMERIYA